MLSWFSRSDFWLSDFYALFHSSRMALQFADFISSPFISFFSLVALPFAIFATLGLDSIFLYVCFVRLEGPQAWALVFRWLSSILSHSCCLSSSHASPGVMCGVSLLEFWFLLFRALWFFVSMALYVLV